jgi:hypothetical protein
VDLEVRTGQASGVLVVPNRTAEKLQFGLDIVVRTRQASVARGRPEQSSGQDSQDRPRLRRSQRPGLGGSGSPPEKNAPADQDQPGLGGSGRPDQDEEDRPAQGGSRRREQPG